MLFAQLATHLDKIEQQSARLAMTVSLAKLYQELSPEEANISSHLLTGQLLPAYSGLEFNLSDKMILSCLAGLVLDYGGLADSGVAVDIFGNQSNDFALSEIKKLYKNSGDLGETAQTVIEKLATPPNTSLTVTQVYKQLLVIAQTNGIGSQEEKKLLLKKLLSSLSGLQAKYVVRVILGKMRLGFSLMTIFDSLSWAATDSKAESQLLEDLYQQKADVGLLATQYLSLLKKTPSLRKQTLLDTYTVSVGVPVVPALCQRLNSASEIIEKMTEVIAEPKYDGMRVQIQIKNGQVWAFTRSLENISHTYPELNTLASELHVENVILDSEVVGYDKKTGAFLTFQDTITRKRKHDIANAAAAVPVKFFVFDILYLNGQSLLHHPLSQRKEILAKILPKNGQVASPTPYLVTDDDKILKDYHEKMLAEGLEGVVVKQTESFYKSGRKGWQWVKIKEEEGTQGKLNDTLDLVVMGYYFGRGKRSGFGIGAFLTGLINEKGEVFSFSKIGTGITDEMFGQLKVLFDQHKTTVAPTTYLVDKTLAPDVWLEPQVVVEIAADEITRSSLHTSGFGLRFPRLIKVRNDKKPPEATKIEELNNITGNAS